MNKLDNYFFFHTQALNVRTERQQMIAANIANADTPHYKARDIDFGKALQGALAGRGEGLALARTSSGHLPGLAAATSPELMFRTETQSAVDGNTVEMDVERAQFSDNAIRYEAGLTFVTGRLKSLIDAMQSSRS
jgi:flagellar basal-body rod protein FlgB